MNYSFSFKNTLYNIESETEIEQKTVETNLIILQDTALNAPDAGVKVRN